VASLQTRDCILLGLQTWSFGQPPWTDMDQTSTICTPLLSGHDEGRGCGNGIAVLAWPPKKLSSAAAVVDSSSSSA